MRERLQEEKSLLTASLWTGLVWGIWHSMDFLMGNWSTNGLHVLLFFAYIIGAAVVIGFFYHISGGCIAIAIVGHYSANAASEFLPLWHDDAGIRTAIIFVLLIWISGVTAAWVVRVPSRERSTGGAEHG